MNHQNIYPDGYDDTVIETATNYTPMPRNLSWMAKHTANMMLDQATLDFAQDKLAAQLARGSISQWPIQVNPPARSSPARNPPMPANMSKNRIIFCLVMVCLLFCYIVLLLPLNCARRPDS